MRIVSLLPSATDIVVALGATDNLVGVSHSCSGDWSQLPKLTSTWVDVEASSAVIDEQVRSASRPLYELDVETLEQLAPDVVISQSLCDVCAVPSGDVMQAILALPGKPELVDLTPNVLSDIPDCFSEVGAAIERKVDADILVGRWHGLFARFRYRHTSHHLRGAFLDWLDPPFVAGHWMPDMLEWLGVECVLGRSGEPSYSITWEELSQVKPDLIIAACCGFDIARTTTEAENQTLPIVCLDGLEHFNRPSPALMQSLEVLSEAIDNHLGYRLRG